MSKSFQNKFSLLGSTSLTGPNRTQARGNIDAQVDLLNVARVELGGSLSGDRVSYIDLHSSGTGSIDYSTRIIRSAGVNGTFEIAQTGTGAVEIEGGGNFTRNGNTIWHAGNDGTGSGLDADLFHGSPPSYFTNIPARLGYTPMDDTRRDGISVWGLVANNPNAPYFRQESTGDLLALQRALGFTPARQGGGVGMLSNVIALGWDGADRVLLQVDASPRGGIITTNQPAIFNRHDVGSYTSARAAAGAIVGGQVVAGSELRTSNTNGDGGTESLPGTWRNMGYNANTTSGSLFQRIA